MLLNSEDLKPTASCFASDLAIVRRNGSTEGCPSHTLALTITNLKYSSSCASPLLQFSQLGTVRNEGRGRGNIPFGGTWSLDVAASLPQYVQMFCLEDIVADGYEPVRFST